MLPLLQLYQPAVSLSELADRQAAHRAARAAADRAGKPLLNVGCPSTNPMWHPCGDVCLDLDPTRLAACRARVPLVGDVRAIPYPAGYFGAAACFHVLEHLPTVADAERALAELGRVADAVYVCSPSRANLMAWIHPEHHLWPIHQADGSIRFVQRRRGDDHGEALYAVVERGWGLWDAAVRALRGGG